MFQRLREKWKVGAWQFALIFCTFASGGSLCGYAGRKLLLLTGLEKGWLFVIAYLLLIMILWPLAVLLVSIPFGQFAFFLTYIRKIGKTMFGGNTASSSVHITRLAIFASGTGSNTGKIIEYFEGHPTIKVTLIVCNKQVAGVLDIAASHSIHSLIIDKEKFFRSNAYINELKDAGIDIIVLAGFLWKLPSALIAAYQGKIINIHPALLPKYGGKGMYGKNVHEAVISAGDKESGISIHYVDEEYDHGSVIFQATCQVDENDNPETLAQKIHALEHLHFPVQLEKIVEGKR